MTNIGGSTFNLNVDQQINTGNAGLPFYASEGRTSSVSIFRGHGNIMYNAMQSTLNRRMRGGLQIGPSWTWQKAEKLRGHALRHSLPIPQYPSGSEQ
jgi:hypothetical protein